MAKSASIAAAAALAAYLPAAAAGQTVSWLDRFWLDPGWLPKDEIRLGAEEGSAFADLLGSPHRGPLVIRPGGLERRVLPDGTVAFTAGDNHRIQAEDGSLVFWLVTEGLEGESGPEFSGARTGLVEIWTPAGLIAESVRDPEILIRGDDMTEEIVISTGEWRSSRRDPAGPEEWLDTVSEAKRLEITARGAPGSLSGPEDEGPLPDQMRIYLEAAAGHIGLGGGGILRPGRFDWAVGRLDIELGAEGGSGTPYLRATIEAAEITAPLGIGLSLGGFSAVLDEAGETASLRVSGLEASPALQRLAGFDLLLPVLGIDAEISGPFGEGGLEGMRSGEVRDVSVDRFDVSLGSAAWRGRGRADGTSGTMTVSGELTGFLEMLRGAGVGDPLRLAGALGIIYAPDEAGADRADITLTVTPDGADVSGGSGGGNAPPRVPWARTGPAPR